MRRAGLVLLATVMIAAEAQASTGQFERAWGKDVDAVTATAGFEICTVAASCQSGAAGGLAGELSAPEGIATDAAGNVYVADLSNNRIQKFDSSGNFLRAWGKDVDAAVGTGFEICTVAANCQTGTQGGLGGELFLPSGLGADPAGNVYVADRFNERIQKFDASGNFQRAWGKDVDVTGGVSFEICTVAANCQTGAQGGLGGELDAPRAVAIDLAGHVYVTDESNERIQRFDVAGGFQRAWGKNVDSAAGTGFEICTVAASCQTGATGGLGGEFSSPSGVATDGTGAVYVAEVTNRRVQKFNAAGGFQRAWGKNVDSAAGTGFEICTVAASCQTGTGGGLGGEFIAPFALATDGVGNVYVADDTAHRVQKFIEPQQPPTPTPSNAFTIGKLKGRKLSVTVPGPGVIEVHDANASKKKVLLKPSSATASGAGSVMLKLKLNSKARKVLKRRRKVRVKAVLTFTPSGGAANSRRHKFTVKSPKKK